VLGNQRIVIPDQGPILLATPTSDEKQLLLMHREGHLHESTSQGSESKLIGHTNPAPHRAEIPARTRLQGTTASPSCLRIVIRPTATQQKFRCMSLDIVAEQEQSPAMGIG
jgi:hypothetical protein